MVAQVQRLRERLEPTRLLLEARDRERSRDGPRSQNESVPSDLPACPVGWFVGRCDGQGTRLQVHPDGVAQNHPRPPQMPVQGHGDVARVYRARGHLGQERAVEQVVGWAYQYEFGVVRPEPLLQLAGAGEPREAGADDQDTPPTSAVREQTA